MNNIPKVLEEEGTKAFRTKSSIFVKVENDLFDFKIRMDLSEPLISILIDESRHVILDDVKVSSGSNQKRK